MPAESGISPEDEEVLDRLRASVRARTPAGAPPTAQLADLTQAVEARSWRWVSFMAHGGGALLLAIGLMIGTAFGAGLGYVVAEHHFPGSGPHAPRIHRAPNGSGPGGSSNAAALGPLVPGAPTTSTTTTTTLPRPAGGGLAQTSAIATSPPAALRSATTTLVPPGPTVLPLSSLPATVPPTSTPPPTALSPPPTTVLPPTTIVPPTTTTVDCQKAPVPHPPRKRRCGQL
jgi:hypothetical protein